MTETETKTEAELKRAVYAIQHLQDYCQKSYWQDVERAIASCRDYLSFVKKTMDRYGLVAESTITFDLDETLFKNASFNLIWNDPLIRYDWSTYIGPLFYLHQWIGSHTTFRIVYVTGRSSTLYALTRENLDKYGLHGTLYCTQKKEERFRKCLPIVASFGDQLGDHSCFSWKAYRLPALYSG